MAEVKLSALSPARKGILAGRIMVLGALAERELARKELPEVVARWGEPDRSTSERVSPHGLGRAVAKVLGARRRCVVQSLVLHRLLAAQGDRPTLVIGLPDDANNQKAHAWIELEGTEVGPPPGRGAHLEMARFT